MSHACRVCGKEFEPTEGQVRHNLWICRKCSREADRARRPRRPKIDLAVTRAYSRRYRESEKGQATRQQYRKSERGRERRNAASRKWCDKPGSNEKRRAHGLLLRALARGDIKKHPCVKCGNLRVHGHHEDYSKPLNVVWLCPA